MIATRSAPMRTRFFHLGKPANHPVRFERSSTQPEAAFVGLRLQSLDVTIGALGDLAPRLASLGVDNGYEVALPVVAATWVWRKILPYDTNRIVLDRPRALLNFSARNAIDNVPFRREVQDGLAALRCCPAWPLFQAVVSSAYQKLTQFVCRHIGGNGRVGRDSDEADPDCFERRRESILHDKPF